MVWQVHNLWKICGGGGEGRGASEKSRIVQFVCVVSVR